MKISQSLTTGMWISAVITFVLYEILWVVLGGGNPTNNTIAIYLFDFCYCSLFIIIAHVLFQILRRKDFFKSFTLASQFALFLTMLLLINSIAWWFEVIYNLIIPAETQELYQKSVFLFCTIATLLTFSHYSGFCYRVILKQNQDIAEFKKQILKNNLTPHFVFNSLNVLAELIYQDQEKAEQYTIHFSNLYRYILSNIDCDYSTLEDSLKVVQDYIALQEVRVIGNIKLTIDVPTLNGNQYLFSMSLQTLIENAIKHNTPDCNETLLISIGKVGNNIFVRNKIKENKSNPESYGIGLETLFQRYRMDNLPVPEINCNDGYYEVRMPIITKNEKNTNYRRRTPFC